MIEILSSTLRALNYGRYGIFLIMGNAGFISSTVTIGKLQVIEGEKCPDYVRLITSLLQA